MRPARVVPGEPSAEALLSLSKSRKLMLPHALLFETAEEAFNHAILFRRVRRHEFLRQPIVATGRSEAAALKDQPVVAADHRHRALWAQRAKSVQAGRFQRSLRFLARPRKAKS